MKVMTTKGPVEWANLFVQDVTEMSDNARKIATEYRLNGELVRRDVAVSMLMPPEPSAVAEGVIS